jgi:fructokinase
VILVCGEALIDLAPAPDRAGAYLPHPGGGPFNTAVALGRLEVPVAFLGRLSTDPFGRRLRRHLADNGVDVGFVVDATEPTTLALVALSDDGHASYGFYVDGTADRGLLPGDLPTPLADDVAAIHLGSLALALDPPATTLVEFVRREKGERVVSVDPNVRGAVIADRDGYVRRIDRLMAVSDVVRVSADDLAWLAPGGGMAAARGWLETGAALVVVTLGGEGCVGLRAGGEVSVPAEPVAVVDTIGAGDSFNAGLLTWLFRAGRLRRDRLEAMSDGELADALRFAGRVAAVTCSRAGADPPRASEVA